MSFELIVKPDAEKDLIEIAEWYEGRVKGLGHNFLLSVEAVFEAIKRNPTLFPEKHLHVRRALTRKFPYSVFYIVEESKIFILAVIHTKRGPDFYSERIK